MKVDNMTVIDVPGLGDPEITTKTWLKAAVELGG